LTFSVDFIPVFASFPRWSGGLYSHGRNSEGRNVDYSETIAIGALSKRTGVATSAIRFYEARGLLTAQRSDGNQRRFLRSDIRRVSMIAIAQRLGLSLPEIDRAMASLPLDRAPTFSEWQRVGRELRAHIDVRVQWLSRARARLDECIGCGCLSLDRCRISNRDDGAGAAGSGPRFVLDEVA